MPSTSEAVRAAKNPQEALLCIAAGLDEVLARLAQLAEQPKPDDGWGDWETRPIVLNGEPTFDIEIGDGATEIVFKLPTEEKLARRRLFASEILKLQDQGLDKYGIEDPIDHYAKGGPFWLYHGNRELFMQYTGDVRAMMVMDVEDDDQEAAREMARDVLKNEEGLSVAFAMEAINGSVPD